MEDEHQQGEVAVNIGSEKTESSSTRKSSNKLRLTFQGVLASVPRKHNNEITPLSSLRSREVALLRSLSKKTSHRLKRTKSRLIDLPEEDEDIEEEEEDDDEEDVCEEDKRIDFNTWIAVLHCGCLVLILTFLIVTLSVPAIRTQTFLDFLLWKWEILVLYLLSSRLFLDWMTRVVLVHIEPRLYRNPKVLYFIHGLKNPVQNCICFGLLLLVWQCIFDTWNLQETNSRVLPDVKKGLVCFFVGSLIWLLKTFLVKILALNFHVNTFFERIEDVWFKEGVIRRLLGSKKSQHQNPENSDMNSDLRTPLLQTNGEISFSKMINLVRQGSLTLNDQVLHSIKSAVQARRLAAQIFENVAEPGSKNIYINDLTEFMKEKKARQTMKLFRLQPDEGISKSALTAWLVNTFRERKALDLSLNDTKTAVDELHIMLNIIVSIIIIIIWFVIFGFHVVNLLVFLGSQVLLAVFIFGETCKTIFESTIFLFVMHPFDVGDRCEVDGVQMIVEEMNILTTLFRRCDDNQMITYPNSVLSTKLIGNFYRSPEMMDIIQFSIHFSTPKEKIDTMKNRIVEYIADNTDKWLQPAMVVVMDVVDLNKVNMAVCATHKFNFQEMGDRHIRKGELVEAMIQIFKDLDLEYRMPSIDVNVGKFNHIEKLGLAS